MSWQLELGPGANVAITKDWWQKKVCREIDYLKRGDWVLISWSTICAVGWFFWWTSGHMINHILKIFQLSSFLFVSSAERMRILLNLFISFTAFWKPFCFFFIATDSRDLSKDLPIGVPELIRAKIAIRYLDDFYGNCWAVFGDVI